MPIEIKELHIKVTVRDGAGAAATTGGDGIYDTRFADSNARDVDPTPWVAASDPVLPDAGVDPHGGWAAPVVPWPGGDIW